MIMSPSSGSRAPPSASALTWALTVPTLAPGVAGAVIVVPVGITIDARAVASSPTADETTTRVVVPVYVTESLAVLYAAVAVAATASAISAARPTVTSRVPFFIDPSWWMSAGK